MPLLDIAVAQPSLQNQCGYTRLHLSKGKITHHSSFQYEERWSSFWKSSRTWGKRKFCLGHHKKLNPKFLVKAVTTFELKCSVQIEDGRKESDAFPAIAHSVSSAVQLESQDAESEEMDAKEKLRRSKISKAMKGNTPWNKGRKHSPETIERIRERTKLAMRNPKVRMKLVHIGHVHSQETKDKIGVGVRMGWKKRRERLALQETCLFDWQNLVAEASRKGFHDEEELQWESYEILKQKLHQEWLDSIEYRKTMPRPRNNKRAPKTLEQRRKIAEAIAAKWADPEYRARVCSGLAKYHGSPEGAERKTKKKPSDEGHSQRTRKKKVSDSEGAGGNELMEKTQPPKLKKQYFPKYKDPLASSKLEMLKSIRAQRLASRTKMTETLARAKILIAEAEKAANALEVAAMRSPVAQASLSETRKLIAEATQTIKTIEKENLSSDLDATSGHYYNEDALRNDPNEEEYPNRLNGIESLQSSQDQPYPDFDFYKLTMEDKMDMNNHLPSSNGGYDQYPKRDMSTSAGIQFGSRLMKLWRNPNVSSLTLTSKSTQAISMTQSEDYKHISVSDLRSLLDQRHLRPEPNDVARLNGSLGPNGAEMHVHEPTSSRKTTVMKKWVRGRLVQVTESK